MFGHLSHAQVRNRLILSARMIVRDHWPVGDGCPVCKVANCWPLRVGCAYLDAVGDTYLPIPKPTDATRILLRGARVNPPVDGQG